MPHIYILGIDPALPPGTITPWGTWDDMQRLIASHIAHAERNAFTITFQKMDGADLEAHLQRFERQLAALRDEGKLDGVLFGAGLRNHTDPVPFERAVGILERLVGEKLGSEVKVMLNDGPDRHCWALERGFGVKMEVE